MWSDLPKITKWVTGSKLGKTSRKKHGGVGCALKKSKRARVQALNQARLQDVHDARMIVVENEEVLENVVENVVQDAVEDLVEDIEGVVYSEDVVEGDSDPHSVDSDPIVLSCPEKEILFPGYSEAVAQCRYLARKVVKNKLHHPPDPQRLLHNAMLNKP